MEGKPGHMLYSTNSPGYAEFSVPSHTRSIHHRAWNSTRRELRRLLMIFAHPHETYSVSSTLCCSRLPAAKAVLVDRSLRMYEFNQPSPLDCSILDALTRGRQYSHAMEIMRQHMNMLCQHTSHFRPYFCSLTV